MCPTTLRVFEHQTVRAGEPLKAADGASVTLGQRELDALARFNDRHAGRYFTMGFQRVTFRQYVGYLQVGRLGIEVLPKADQRPLSAGGDTEWRDALLNMLRVAFGMKLYAPGIASQAVGRSSLLELLVLKFVSEVERLLHEGLAKGYRTVEANGTAFRGRLMVSENLRENLARADRFYVRFSSFDTNTLLNRVLGYALTSLRALALSPALRARVSAVELAFPDIDVGRVSVHDLDRIRLARSTKRYETALTLSRMLLEHQAPTLRSGSANVFALLFDMNQLWERYVTAILRRAAPQGTTVHAQDSRPFWRATGRPARLVRPDIVVRRDGQVTLIADAKWKLYGGEPSIGELQQMFVYNEQWRSPRAALIYPGRPSAKVTGRFQSREHTCDAVLLDALGKQPERELWGLLAGDAAKGG